MKFKYLMIAVVTASVLFSSCKEASDTYAAVYMTAAQKVESSSVTIDTPPAYVDITVSSSVEVAKDTEVTLETRSDLLDAYNVKHGKNYAPLPDGSFSLSSNKLTIKSGYSLSSPVELVINSISGFMEGVTYCMPVSIKSVNSQIAILEPSKTLFVVFKTPVVSKAIYIGSSNKYNVPSFAEDASLSALSQMTLETRVYVDNFQNGADNSSIMGIEGMCAVRFGDVKIDKNIMQICHESYQPAATSKPFDTGKWYHVAAVWSGSSWDIYVDGQYVTGVATQGETLNLNETAGNWGFGLGAFSDWQGGRPLQGYLAETRVWKRALSANEIANNMNYIDPKSEGLVAYWRMNSWELNPDGGGNVVRDMTGNGHDAFGLSTNPTMMDTKWM